MVKEIKNILLVGRTGSGKSALANVLLNSFKEDTEFQEIFKESLYGASETKDIQMEEFEWEGINYRIIDTPGVDNTKLSKEEKNLFKLLENIFGRNVKKYITIVRTEFVNFAWDNEEDKIRVEEECKKDKEFLIEEIKKISDSFSSCKVIHVDNPPLVGYSTEPAKESREISRKILLSHLENNCQESYRLDIDKISKEAELRNMTEEQSWWLSLWFRIRDKLRS